MALQEKENREYKNEQEFVQVEIGFDDEASRVSQTTFSNPQEGPNSGQKEQCSQPWPTNNFII